jgi:hypothetical protein
VTSAARASIASASELLAGLSVQPWEPEEVQKAIIRMDIALDRLSRHATAGSPTMVMRAEAGGLRTAPRRPLPAA